MRQGTRRPLVAVAATLSVLAFSLAVVNGSAPRARADSQNVSITDALSEAADTGDPVLATAAATETSTVTANPDGTLTSVIGAGPMQEPDPESPTGWTPIDLSLSHDDGAYAPAVSGADVSFSDGGTGALATLDAGDTTYTEDWQGSLPVPSVAGDTATYANVYVRHEAPLTEWE
jgi:hypothetical protein